MANLLLTEKCVRSCPYCFAKQHMSESTPEDILSWENLLYVTDFLDTSNEKAISLLGGEPFLHPQIVDYIMYLVERKFHVNIFTSGIISNSIFDSAIKYLLPISPDMLSFVCNLNDPDKTPYAEKESIRNFLFHFGHLSTLSLNIYRNNFDINYAIQFINEFGLKKHVRLGLAHPIPGQNNSYIKPVDLRKMAEKLLVVLEKFYELNIEPGFDCGFPFCIFTDEEIGKLYKYCKSRVTFSCGPAIDIGPDLSVWACFPLSNYLKKNLLEFNSFQEVFEYYSNYHNKLRAELGGIFPECDNCKEFINKTCSGGCLAHCLNRIIKEPKIRSNEFYPCE